LEEKKRKRQPECVALSDSPPPAITSNEDDKREKRLIRNRQAAQISRERKKRRFEELEEENQRLQDLIEQLRAENQLLRVTSNFDNSAQLKVNSPSETSNLSASTDSSEYFDLESALYPQNPLMTSFEVSSPASSDFSSCVPSPEGLAGCATLLDFEQQSQDTWPNSQQQQQQLQCDVTIQPNLFLNGSLQASLADLSDSSGEPAALIRNSLQLEESEILCYGTSQPFLKDEQSQFVAQVLAVMLCALSLCVTDTLLRLVSSSPKTGGVESGDEQQQRNPSSTWTWMPLSQVSRLAASPNGRRKKGRWKEDCVGFPSTKEPSPSLSLQLLSSDLTTVPSTVCLCA